MLNKSALWESCHNIYLSASVNTVLLPPPPIDPVEV